MSHPLRGKQEQALISGLRSFLRARLPEHMVPAVFVRLDELPLTASGKVDRQALPPPGERICAPPSELKSELESELAAMWQEVLHLERVGAGDSFFDLGGHSLSAVRLFSRIRQRFGVEVKFQGFFQDPTLAGLASLIRQAKDTEPDDLIPRLPRGGGLPLSYAQERLWFLYRLAPESRAYNCAYSFRLHGRLDVAALEASLDGLVRRHEPLRTRFAEVDGRPAQIIDPPTPLSLPVADLQGCAPIEADRLLEEEARRRFSLEQGPLFHARLLKLGPEQHVLMLHFHHIAVDGWSIEVAFREISHLYQRPDATLPELPIQYADYAAWQRRRLALTDELDFWRERLAGAPPLLEVPADHPRPAVQSFRGGSVPCPLPPGLRQLAQREDATLATTLLAVYLALLHRYTQREDLLVGIPSAGRDRVELEGLLGFFVNTLPLRVEVSGEPPFQELLARTRRETLAAYERDRVPFERLVQELSPARTASYNPLVQIGFVPLPPAEVDLRLHGLSSRYVDTDARKTVLDLSLYFWEENEGIGASIEHSTDLYERPTIERLARHLRNLAEAAVADPRRTVAELPLLSSAERAQILVEWNDTARVSNPASVHDLFAAQAARTPEAVAVEQGADRLTYRELAARSSRLAGFLQKHGVGPEVRVGCSVGRSPGMAVGFLAILEAGGVYVPLDPGYPRQRLDLLLEDSAPALVLTQDHLRHLDSGDWATATVDPRSAAYVIYTSGSSGRPKGVVVEHGSARPPGPGAGELLGIGPGRPRAAVSALGFDASIWEFLMALLTGGTLCVPPAGRRAPPGPTCCELLRGERITAVDPAALVLAALPARAAAGPALCWSSPARPARRSWSSAGRPAAACQRLRPDRGHGLRRHWASPLGRRAPPPIGRPLRGVRVYVLDAAGSRCRSACRASSTSAGRRRARLPRPARADRRALRPRPVRGMPGARLYRTGDRVRWRADGTLEFLGRAGRPGQAARLPHRARRDRGGAAPATRRSGRTRLS